MQELRLLVVLWLASLTPQAWAAVRVKGFAASGEPVGTLNVPGPDSKRYQVAYSSFLATPTTQAAENFAPLQWHARSTPDDPSQDPLDHSFIPAIVNTQLVTPWVANDVAVKATFPGIDVNDEERANVRPPNPSLCVGNDYVMEVSDMVIKVWDMSGKLLAGPVTLTDFFGSQHSSGRFSNAFCVFDAADTGRFYISMLNYTLAGGLHLGTSQLLLAASASGDPTEGFLGPFSVPTTGLDPATGYKEVLHGLEGCKNMNPDLPNGCMASGPTVGIDQHGLWIGLNLYQTYSIVTAGNYTAPLLLGISKASLLAGGRATPAYAAVTDWDRDVTFTLAPSLTQGASAHCAENNGTVFVASSGPTLAQASAPKSELLLWAISGTATLSDPDFPRGGVPQHNGTAALHTWKYADPTAAQVVVTQPDGGTALDQGDSRLTQLAYSDGMLWTAAATAVLINGLGDPLEGTAWWALQPAWNQSRFEPRIVSQGYVTVMGNHVINPVITASSAGSGVPTGVLAASLVGPDYHLSPIWTPINMQLGAGAIHMPVVSKTTLTGPQGDDQASTLLNGRSAATTDANGVAWVTSEWAAGSPTQFCQSEQLLSYDTSCTNWGTQITAVSMDKWP